MNNRIKNAQTYFNNTEKYLSQNYDINFRAQILKSILGNVSHSNILDLGCGNGLLSLQFQSDTNRITLVDISPNMLSAARTKILAPYKNNIQIINTSITDYQSEEQFDLIIASGILAHVKSVEETIQKISCLLSESGTCIFQLTDSEQMLSKALLWYNNLLDIISNKFGYKRNIIPLTSVINLSNQYGLHKISQHRYSFLLPGMHTLLPNSLLYSIYKFTYNNKCFSKICSDVIIAFKK